MCVVRFGRDTTMASPSKPNHLGKVPVASQTSFVRALERYVANLDDKKCFDFYNYNNMHRSQSVDCRAIWAIRDFIKVLVDVFGAGRATPTFLQNGMNVFQARGGEGWGGVGP